MAVFAVRIIKSTIFEGERREFGNTYHFRTTTGQIFLDQGVAEECASAEKPISSADVRFDRWETYGPTDGPRIDNVMREAGTLPTGIGSLNLASPLMKEYGALVVWPLPRAPVTNVKRWLRKFLRSAPGDALTTTQAKEGGPLSASAKANLATYAARIADLTVGTVTYSYSSEEGTLPIAPGLGRDFMTTREIGSAH